MHSSYSLIAFLIFLCVFILSSSFRLEVGMSFSGLNIGVCGAGLSCDSVFLKCVRRWCHWEGESEFLFFIGEDECVSQISWGGGCLTYVLQLLRYTGPRYQKHVYSLMREPFPPLLTLLKIPY